MRLTESRSSALAAIYRDPAVIRHHPARTAPVVIDGSASSAIISQAMPLSPSERLAKYSKKVEQRGYVGIFAMAGLIAFMAFEFSTFFFDVASPLHFTFVPTLLAKLSPEDRQRVVSALARSDSLPEDLGSEDPYLVQRDFVPGKNLLFPTAVKARSAEEAVGLIKLGFGAVEIAGDNAKEINLKCDDLTRHALVGVRVEVGAEVVDLLECFDWVTVQIGDVREVQKVDELLPP